MACERSRWTARALITPSTVSAAAAAVSAAIAVYVPVHSAGSPAMASPLTMKIASAAPETMP